MDKPPSNNLSINDEKLSIVQRRLLEPYGGKMEPYNHTADIVHQTAVNAFIHRGGGFMYGPKVVAEVIRTGGANLWRAPKQVKTEIEGHDVVFSLVTERRRGIDKARKVAQQVINLVVNEELLVPAATILPPTDQRKSAAVVVGGEVNKPDDLEYILGIVQRINSNWYS